MKLNGKIHFIKIGPIPIFENILAAVYAIVGKNITLIDSGMPYSWEDSILPYLKKIGRDPKDVSLLICSHNATDHVGSNEFIKRCCGAQIAMHEMGAEDSENPGFLRERYLQRYDQYMTETEKKEMREKPLLKRVKVDIRLHDGDKLNIEGLDVRVIHTPGHSDDSISLYIPEKKVLLTGDSVQGGGSAPPITFINDVEKYLVSMNKLKYLRINRMLAGHAYIPFDPRVDMPVFDGDAATMLIKESIARTERERAEVLNALFDDSISINELARIMSKYLFDTEDKEALVLPKVRAHLRTLVDEGWAEIKRDGHSVAFIRGRP